MYDIGFRTAALRVYKALGSLRATVALVGGSIASLSRWAGRLLPAQRPCQRGTFSEQMKVFLREALLLKPHLSAAQCAAAIFASFGVQVSRQLIQVVVRRLGFSFKRIRKRGISTKSVDLLPDFSAAFLRAYASGTLAAIDESGFDQRPQRTLYGYALRGQPAIVRFRNWKDHRRHSLILAAHGDGTSHHVLSTNHTDSVFAAFVRALPFPRGTTLLVDNARFHHSAAVLASAQQMGYSFLHTPPYSPELNPIELLFGLIKNRFYKARYEGASDGETSRNATHLVNVIGQSVDRVVNDNQTICRCFDHVAVSIQRVPPAVQPSALLGA
jgi:hypothetical protein